MEFNDQHYRYLPSNLKYLLEDPPTKYDIFPKHMVVSPEQSNSDPKFEEQAFDPSKIINFLEGWESS